MAWYVYIIALVALVSLFFNYHLYNLCRTLKSTLKAYDIEPFPKEVKDDDGNTTDNSIVN